MKGIINLTELALLYYAQRETNPYENADKARKIVARSNFRKSVALNPDHLKEAKRLYLEAVKAELKKITPAQPKSNGG